jgi:hypothetical protein
LLASVHVVLEADPAALVAGIDEVDRRPEDDLFKDSAHDFSDLAASRGLPLISGKRQTKPGSSRKFSQADGPCLLKRVVGSFAGAAST